jgi:hypothetical protein
MVEPLRHRQTKGAETDMLDLTPPRHVSTLPTPDGYGRRVAQIAAMSGRRPVVKGRFEPVVSARVAVMSSA